MPLLRRTTSLWTTGRPASRAVQLPRRYDPAIRSWLGLWLPYGRLLLAQARASLENKPSQNPHVYTQLLSAYAEYLPEDVPPVFTLVLKGLNQIKYEDPREANKNAASDKKKSMSWVPLGSRLEPTITGLSLLERDDAYVLASTKGLDDPRTRASFRLGYLQVALKRYEDMKKAKPKQADTPAKVLTETQPPARKN